MNLVTWLAENELTIEVRSSTDVRLATNEVSRRLQVQLVGLNPNTTVSRDDHWRVNASMTNGECEEMPLVMYAVLNMVGEIIGREVYVEQIIQPKDTPSRRERIGTVMVPKSFDVEECVQSIITMLENNCA